MKQNIKTTNKFNNICNEKNWIVLKYDNTSKKYTIQCNNAHIFDRTIHTIKYNSVCKECLTLIRVELASNVANKKGGKLLKNITNSIGLWQCKREHIFQQSFSKIIKADRWCSKCNTKWKSEEICRELFETIFNKSFPKYRAKWLKNSNGNTLELDGYCEELGIAFEHNGLHHYSSNKCFNPNDFTKIQKNDIEKQNKCKEKDIKIIYIPQLKKITKLENLVNFVYDELEKNNIVLERKDITIQNIYEKLYNNLDRSEEYIINAHNYAKQKNGLCLSTSCIYVGDILEWQCERGHPWKSTYTNTVANNKWCQNCCQRKYWLEKDYLLDLAINKRYSLSKISEITNIPIRAVYTLVQHHNIKLFRSKLCDLKKETLIELYVNQKLSSYSIAKQYNTSPPSIRRKLRQFNIPINPFGTNGSTIKDNV